MFGFGRNKHVQEHRRLTDLWIRCSLLSVEVNALKANPDKFKMALAFLFGPTDALGRSMGLSQEEIATVYCKCLNSHLQLDASAGHAAYNTLGDISEDMKYVEIMRYGINVFQKWQESPQTPFPSMLGGLYIGRRVL